MSPIDKKTPIRVLHVVGGMNRGGIETWLMYVLRHIDRDRFSFDFLVHTEQPCAYDEEIRRLGSSIIPCTNPKHLWQYAKHLLQVLNDKGPYDVLHSHVHHFSGWVLRCGTKAKIPIRIAHSHTDTVNKDHIADAFRQIYLRFMEYWVNRHATLGFAFSNQSMVSLFGKHWKKDARWRKLNYGLDFKPFLATVDRKITREKLAIPFDAFVVGHVGRFSEPKNHVFILDIFNKISKKEPKAMLLLVGDGQLRPSIEEKAAQLKLRDRIVFTGVRTDVPRLMLGAMDTFLFPSLYEGLGFVLVEAQAAGLPCIISDVIPTEADAVPGLIRRLSFNHSLKEWADEILLTKMKPPISRDSVHRSSAFNDFDIERSVGILCKFYSEPHYSSGKKCI